jgi:hypothetical protein
MFIHVPRNIGDVKIGVSLIRELLELGIERFLGAVSENCIYASNSTYSSKADFVAQEVEATDACLSVVKVVELNEAEAVVRQHGVHKKLIRFTHPLHKLVLRSMIDFELWISPKRVPQT